MSDLENKKVINILKNSGALLKGHFLLRSGLHSEYFFQCARVGENLKDVSLLVEILLQKIRSNFPEFETVVAPAIGALVIGQELARQSGARFIFLEKESNVLVLRRDFKISSGEKVLIVEDVITRGGRVEEAMKILDKHSAKVLGIAVLVDRSQGKANFSIPCCSLLEMSFPTYKPDELPDNLKKIPALKPGS